MKFFDSKYFVNTCDLNLDYSEAIQTKIEIAAEGMLVHETLRRFATAIGIGSEWEINYDKVIAEWTPVEDLVAQVDARLPIEQGGPDTVNYFRVYFHPDTESFLMLREFGESNYSNYGLYIPLDVNHEGVFHQLVQEGYYLWQEQDDEDTTPVFGMLVVTQSGFDISYVELKPTDIDLELHYGKGFTDISNQIVEYTSREDGNGLIILHGVPGTGKTSYIRWLSGQAERPFVYIPTEVVHQLSSTTFAAFLMQNTGLTFVLEDAETILMAREDGQSNNQVASILNMTDGILGDIFNSQFICTFNTDISKVDKALLRPGRLLISHDFKPLSVDDSNTLLKHLGKDRLVREPATLALLMND